ncbi:DUF262 domain-containing protein [Flavobacterium columnare]|uniref:DUF262 domain-containing protein n=1 Tax=Flavobacterium columnare TaxID=996 RepID=A0AAI8CFY3_9FLAO|nr:DUF262 domain-containing protein [Flavobacterium columnare]AMO19447.1 DUF262 domain-containing protein [Flavobacterium columnare]MBF6653974.1 DUF262 domain-containing protein [Flavobacterium columnare]MBF6654591.1 DUF262 domain-containing protein [Flavobacterium columnare]MBF6659029.1 DUF262 domain-containing protein [Flavobacterium columnare]MEB3800192.1 DUF262 domain-containing protein [Flavobacterium columnare]
MADKNLMTPSTSSLSGLLGNGVTYKVPIFQRDYSWKVDNWTDLWEDIKILLNTGKDHYMGAVVLQKIGEKQFLVIDGQQRFTTLSLLALAIIKKIQDLIDSGIEPEDNTERISELRRGFLGQKDPASLHYSSKLFLNENNDPFYQRNLLQLISPQNELMLIDSDRLLWQAFDFFYKKIGELYSNATGSELATFLSKSIGDKTMFIKIEVEDELSAYTLFETLNYRGVDLTVSDLLKNYLFSLITPSDLRIAKDIWKKIATSVGIDKFPVFLRHFWISRKPLVRQEQLFKTIRTEIKSNQQVFDLLNDLDRYSETYLALQDPFNVLWQGNRERIKRIREMKLFGVKQQLPLLMVAKEKFSDQEFDKTLKVISTISFRYNVIGSRQANRMEELYNSVSQKIFNLSLTTAQGIFNEIRELYISDADFKNDFSTLKLYSYGRTKKLARYILFELENNLMQGGDRDYELDPATIEHILPENAGANWDNDFPQIIQPNYIYRLGNYTLLEDHINRDCEILPFDQKKAFYSNSQYQMSNEINYNDWNPTILDRRQNDLARKATSIWRISYT